MTCKIVIEIPVADLADAVAKRAVAEAACAELISSEPNVRVSAKLTRASGRRAAGRPRFDSLARYEEYE